MITHTLLPTQTGKSLAVITFEKEKSLNAQDVSMVKTIATLLTDWQNNSDIVAIVMRGAGEKAFCAGGDIKGLYNALADNTPAQIGEFFENEYALMYKLHTYNKPIIAWGNGIVMGGGLGLLAGASHKVVTETTLMAMPEVSIGLFPDAGGTYFLNRMPNKVGLFLGLTGARFSGADAYQLGLADFMIDKDNYQTMIDNLLLANWQTNDKDNFGVANNVLNTLHNHQFTQNSQVLNHLNEINALMNAGNLSDIDNAIIHYKGDSEFINNAKEFYVNGSPITKVLTFKLYHKSKVLSLKEILTLELHSAIACCVKGDFKEGVRALLIDKDKNPNWQFKLSDITDDYINDYLKSPYGDTHPFADL